MLSATLKVEAPDPGALLASLRPEAGRELPRTRTSLRLEGGRVVIGFEAADAAAMRAALNSYLGCIGIAEDIYRITGA